MQIIKAEQSSYTIIEEFLKPWEHTCVTLCAKHRKLDDHIYIISNDLQINDINDICGVLCIDGTLLHCIPHPDDEILSCFKEFAKDKKIRVISGKTDVTELLIMQLQEFQTPAQVNHYTLMTLEQIALPPPEPLSFDDQIFRCTEDNLDILLELQKQYLIKEVAPAGKQVTELECRVSLRQILKNQLMFALYADGELVAKANTNAIGWNYVQIGGVYTHPLFRRNYYAWHLLKVLCDRIQKTQKKVALFVKEKNTPAIKLYEKMGFTAVNHYAIAYF